MKTIVIKDYTVSYAGEGEAAVPVFEDINIEIESGETVLITGSSGCGKTTLLRSINGLIPGFIDAQTSGSICVGDRLIEETEPREIASIVGMVFQDPRAEFFAHDVISELAFPCENFNIPSEEIAARIERVAEELSIGNLLGRRLSKLSSGEKQKVAIAAAMMLNPSVLLFDEPSANLDHEGLQSLAETIGKLKATGHTIIIADHRLQYLIDVLDRCVVLEGGQVTEVVAAPDLRQLPSDWFSERGLRQVKLDADRTALLPVGESALTEDGPRLVNLKYTYPRAETLWSIRDLQFPRKGIIGLTGANGCGKTTLLKVIMGLLRPERGGVYLRNRPWRTKQRRRDCAYVMQDVDYQLAGETVWDEMFIGLDQNSESEARARNLLSRVNLSQFRDRHPLTLSGGQKQRLGIALACMKQAAIICLDEPTSGLDARNMNRVADLLRELAEDGSLIILIIHDQEFATLTLDAEIAISDRSVSLHLIPSPQPSH